MSQQREPLQPSAADFLTPLLSESLNLEEEAATSAMSGEGLLAPGTRIAGFVVEAFVACGGSGEVYRARQIAPARTVALKVLHRHLLQTRALPRLEREAQILGELAHEGIARIYAAWSPAEPSAGERPWIAMEWIEGGEDGPWTITRYCQDHCPSLRQKLELFLVAVRAIGHAHHNGIVHRDIKPSNLLVDRLGRPKVIDFGIADLRATLGPSQQDLTHAGELLGTLYSMSPEQLTGERVEVPSDIYSLGVVLYEILCGRLPYQSAGDHTFAVAHEIVREGIVRPRRSDRLPRDLVCILLRCLERSPSARYQSAPELAQELERFLAGQRVLARAPNPLVDLLRLARRHPVSATLVSTLGLGLAVATGLALHQAWRASKTARSAILRKDYLVDLWSAPLQSLSLHEPLTVGGMLQNATSQLERTFGEDPLAYAELASRFGAAYRLLGDYARAEPLLARSLALHEEHLETGALATNETRLQLAVLRFKQGAWGEATQLLEHVLDAVQGLDAKSLELRTRAKGWLGNVLLQCGELERAEAYLAEALQARSRDLGELHRETLSLRSAQASLRRAQGRAAEAEALFRLVLEEQRAQFSAEDLDTAVSANNFALLLSDQGRLVEAEALLAEVHGIYQQVYGANHPSTWLAENNLATVHARLGRIQEAETSFRRLLEQEEQTFGAAHEHAVRTRLSLGRLCLAGDRVAEAMDCLRPALAVVDPTWPASLRCYLLGSLGIGLSLSGDWERALALLHECDLSAPHGLPLEPSFVLELALAQAEALLRLERVEEAQAKVQAAEELLIKLRATPRALPTRVHCLRAQLLAVAGEEGQAEIQLVDELALGEGAAGAVNLAQAQCLAALGEVLCSSDRLLEASELFERALPTLESCLGANSPRVAAVLRLMINCLTSEGRQLEAESYRERLSSAEARRDP